MRCIVICSFITLCWQPLRLRSSLISYRPEFKYFLVLGHWLGILHQPRQKFLTVDRFCHSDTRDFRGSQFWCILTGAEFSSQLLFIGGNIDRNVKFKVKKVSWLSIRNTIEFSKNRIDCLSYLSDQFLFNVVERPVCGHLHCSTLDKPLFPKFLNDFEVRTAQLVMIWTWTYVFVANFGCRGSVNEHFIILRRYPTRVQYNFWTTSSPSTM